MSMAEAPLLKRPLVEAAEPEGREGEGGSASPPSPVILTMIGFMFLAFSAAMAVSSWHGGFGAVSFVVVSFLGLGMLFHCLRLYARTPPASPRREVLKMAAWLLATMLTVTFFQLLELWFVTMGKTDHGFPETTPHGVMYTI